jgi:mRNA-degrading endonuclease RelE of RelBE toxin-antitoxin system
VRVRLVVSERFIRRVERLPPHRAKAARRALAKFLAQPLLPGLKFEKLRNLSEDYWSIRSGKGDRIVLKRVTDDEFEAVDVGTHDVYDRLK